MSTQSVPFVAHPARHEHPGNRFGQSLLQTQNFSQKFPIVTHGQRGPQDSPGWSHGSKL